MEKERASLGFDDELADFDPADWTPGQKKTANDRPKPDETAAAADAAGFQSREAGRAVKPAKEQRRHRTGRNVQVNIKTRQAPIDELYAISDAQGWVLGETFEHAIAALKEKLDADRVG